ncbi:MAG: DNA-3-methyladenine glycosylase 2 family protein [Ruminococcaceae bacterium]|nr:DNA-3-methyladenine glycosylase 2 family protein [Oscillospiraceae bacterium]
MEVKFANGDILVSGVECFDLGLTLDCGQAFRWEKQNDGSFSGVAGGHFLNISKNEDGDLIFKNTDKDIFDSFFVNYFDLNKDYKKICDTLRQDDLLKSTIDEYYGIRILNQEPWEALCSFVISQQNNIKRIKLIISRLCREYGDEVSDGWYSFPSAERLSKLSEDDFAALGCGYRSKYLVKLARDVADGTVNLQKIKSLPLEEARKELLNIYGVGIKVANCALLFGFQFYSAFPVDVWMKRVMEYYPDGLPECFDGIEGIAQQYLFHWARNNL